MLNLWFIFKIFLLLFQLEIFLLFLLLLSQLSNFRTHFIRNISLYLRHLLQLARICRSFFLLSSSQRRLLLRRKQLRITGLNTSKLPNLRLDLFFTVKPQIIDDLSTALADGISKSLLVFLHFLLVRLGLLQDVRFHVLDSHLLLMVFEFFGCFIAEFC